MDKAATDNRSNQQNPNHAPTGPGKVQQSFVYGSPHWNPIKVLQLKVRLSKGHPITGHEGPEGGADV